MMRVASRRSHYDSSEAGSTNAVLNALDKTDVRVSSWLLFPLTLLCCLNLLCSASARCGLRAGSAELNAGCP